jgi:hypothetical protein
MIPMWGANGQATPDGVLQRCGQTWAEAQARPPTCPGAQRAAARRGSTQGDSWADAVS